MPLRASWLPLTVDAGTGRGEGGSDLLAETSTAWDFAGHDAAAPQRDLDNRLDRSVESRSDSGVASDDETSRSDNALGDESDHDVGEPHWPSDASDTLSLADDGFTLPLSPPTTRDDMGYWASRNTLPLSVELEIAANPDWLVIDEGRFSDRLTRYSNENDSTENGGEQATAVIADSHRMSVAAPNSHANAVRLDEKHQGWEETLFRLSDKMTAMDASKDWVLPYRGATDRKLMRVSGGPDQLSEFYDADAIGLAQRLDALQRKSDALTALVSECGEVEQTMRAAECGDKMAPASQQLLNRYRELRETWQRTLNADYGVTLKQGKIRLAQEQVHQIGVRYADASWRDAATLASRTNPMGRTDDMSEEACSAFCFHYLTNDALNHPFAALSFHNFTPSPQRSDYPVEQNGPCALERYSTQWARDRDILIELRSEFASIPNGKFADQCTRLISSLSVAVEKAHEVLAALR